jgi:hypothetical protein
VKAEKRAIVQRVGAFNFLVMKNLFFLGVLLFCGTEIFATHIIVRGRAGNVTIDPLTKIVTIPCDGFYQDDVCYEMTMTVNEVHITNEVGEVIYSGTLLNESITHQDGNSIYKFEFE